LSQKSVAPGELRRTADQRIDGVGQQCQVEQFGQDGTLCFDELAVNAGQIYLADEDARSRMAL
jgi:hypothetical protein